MSHNVKVLTVVGDKFINLTKQVDILTFSQMEEFLIKLRDRVERGVYVINLGQGLHALQLNKLKQLINKANTHKNIIFNQQTPTKRASKILTHKRVEENILISEPQQINKDNYQAYLLIDDACAEMSDHVTGQHLQGMVLIEAARQLTLAVTEKYFIEEQDRKDVGFVTEKLETHFLLYAFPIETSMEYRILRNRGNKRNRAFQVEIKFMQNHQVVTQVNYAFSMFDKAFLYQKENLAAMHAVAKPNQNVVAA